MIAPGLDPTAQPICSRQRQNATSPWMLSAGEAFNGDLATGNRGRREKIAGRRGVGLDGIGATAIG